ncbi:MAG: 4Fe-4S binding protein [Bacteriovoracaceae bacterium]|nr:4Fe-4S binding protein [Bacteriovoracaceae bacterium]
MKPYFKISSRCIGCDSCRLLCPKNSIIKNGDAYEIETWSCNLCHICAEVCPVDCIKLVTSEDESNSYIKSTVF